MALHTEFSAAERLLPMWEDVDLCRRGMSVRAAYAKNSERRSVPMNEVLTATLQAVRMSTAADGPVLRSYTGISYRYFCTALTHAVREAGMRDFTLKTALLP
jgi:hypothetical protein